MLPFKGFELSRCISGSKPAKIKRTLRDSNAGLPTYIVCCLWLRHSATELSIFEFKIRSGTELSVPSPSNRTTKYWDGNDVRCLDHWTKRPLYQFNGEVIKRQIFNIVLSLRIRIGHNQHDFDVVRRGFWRQVGLCRFHFKLPGCHRPEIQRGGKRRTEWINTRTTNKNDTAIVPHSGVFDGGDSAEAKAIDAPTITQFQFGKHIIRDKEN
jgi:hypothetical protein